MHKTHKIKLYPSVGQEILLGKSCGVARFSFNWALAKWKGLYEQGEKPSAYSLVKLQNSIKREEWPWMLEVSKNCPQHAIHNVEKAWKNYFRRLKDGTIEKQKKEYIQKRKSKGLEVNKNKLKSIGKPKFKKKGGVGSFVAIENRHTFKQEGKKIKLPKIGWVKCAEDLRFEGKVNNVVVKEVAGMWFATVNIETETPTLKRKGENQSIVGVDFGIKNLMTLSDGTVIENPKALESNLKKLQREQRKLSRKVYKSNNWYKQKDKVAKVHYKVSNIRSNAIHQSTSMLVKNYDVIVIEDLDVGSMKGNRRFNRLISDVGFYSMRQALEYKSEWNGNKLIIADRYFPSSQTCSACGNQRKIHLSERIYKCECGHNQDRDLNAAINLANYSPTSKIGGSYASGDLARVESLNEELNLTN